MKIDLKKMNKGRDIIPEDILMIFKSHGPIFWSWGADEFTNFQRKVMRFTVSGNLHKGWVFLSVSASDLYDITLTDKKGNIISETKDIYLEDLFTTLDELIEKIPAYKI